MKISVTKQLLIVSLILPIFTSAQSDTIDISEINFHIDDINNELIITLNNRLFSGVYKEKEVSLITYTSVEHGVIKSYKSYNGKILYSSSEYLGGGVDEEMQFDLHGNLVAKGYNFNKKKHGIWKYYFTDGNLEREENYNQGIKIQNWDYYNTKGEKILQIEYVNQIPAIVFHKEMKIDTLKFEKLKLKLENCKIPKGISERFSKDSIGYEQKIYKDSLNYCKRNYLNTNKEDKFYTGYAYNISKDSLYFLENGIIKFLKIYDDSQLISFMEVSDKAIQNGLFYIFYSNGALKESGKYFYGKLDGEIINYFYDGKIKSFNYYTKGNPYGWWDYLNQNGELWRREFYVDKEMVAIAYLEKINKDVYMKYYDIEGVLVFEEIYGINGKKKSSKYYQNNPVVNKVSSDGKILTHDPPKQKEKNADSENK